MNLRPALAPLVLFVFNRPDHTAQTLRALQADPFASNSDLTVFSDGPRRDADIALVADTRSILRDVKGFRSVTVHESRENKGLAASVISGVSQIVSAHGRVIVLEDDLEVIPGFLEFMNRALDAYEADRRVFAISGWSPLLPAAAKYRKSVFLSPRALCWGWATWNDRWEKIDWAVQDYPKFERDSRDQSGFAAGGDDLPDMLDHAMRGLNQSWAVKWAFAQYRQGAFSVVPVATYVRNRGLDNSGTHTSAKIAFPTAPVATGPVSLPDSLAPDAAMSEGIRRYYSYNWRAKIKKLLGLM